MFDNQNTVGDVSGGQLSTRIANGMTVYDGAGDKVGTVRNYDPSTGYIDVHKGWLFPKDIYVPLTAVNSTDEEAVYLNLIKDDLSGDQYETPPTGSATYSGDVDSGMDYTTTDTARGYSAAGTGQYNSTDATSYSGSMAGSDQRDVRIPVREEELVAGKRAEEQGRVHIHKDVVEEQETVDVPVTRERVTVERVPYSGSADGISTDDAFAERDIDVPVMGEEVVAEKRSRGVEEVRIRKDAVTENVPVTDTVRKERVSVDADPDDLLTDKVRGTSAKRNVDRMGNRVEDVASDATTDVRRTTRDI